MLNRMPDDIVYYMYFSVAKGDVELLCTLRTTFASAFRWSREARPLSLSIGENTLVSGMCTLSTSRVETRVIHAISPIDHREVSITIDLFYEDASASSLPHSVAVWHVMRSATKYFYAHCREKAIVPFRCHSCFPAFHRAFDLLSVTHQ